MNKNRFSTFEDMTKVMSNDLILQVVNKFLAERAKRNAYHANYNERRKILANRMKALEAQAVAKGISIEDLLEGTDDDDEKE